MRTVITCHSQLSTVIKYSLANQEIVEQFLEFTDVSADCISNALAVHVQSHLYIRRGNRRLSLAVLPGLPAASRGVKLPLLANTRSVC